MTNTQKKVCVIGGGASGITSMKQLVDEGHIPTCYEKSSDMGGVFYYQNDEQNNESENRVNTLYKNTVLTISNYLMCYSDMPPKGPRRHWHHSEYKQYLNDYIENFGLRKYIKLQHQVLKVTMIDGGHSGYEVTVKNANGERYTEKYDAIVVCTGTHQLPSVPNIKGIEGFEGKVIHASDYDSNDIAKGKRVLCVGLGESSADITREVSEVASECYLGLRSYPFLIPRNLDHSSSDSWTSRLHHDYHTPKNEGVLSYIVLFLYFIFLKPFLFKKYEPKNDSFMQDATKNMIDMNTPGDVENIKLIKAWNYLSKGRRFATKNVTFIPNVVNGKIKVNASGISEFTNDSVLFQDGEKKQIDMIVFATGYHESFDFIEGFNLPDNNVRNMFMNAHHPNLPNCAFIGWARPVTGGIPACSEMSARYFAMLLSGKVTLPHDMRERIEADKKFYNEFYSKNSAKVHTVVGWKRHMENYAELIGCQVNTYKYILQPSLFVKLFAGSLVPYQYRLEGPHSMRKSSIAAIKSVPITLPPEHILYGIKMNLFNKINYLKERALKRKISLEYSQFFSEWFRFDVKLTLDDVKRFTFRKDNMDTQLKELN